MKLFLLSSLALFHLAAGSTAPSSGNGLLRSKTKQLGFDPSFLEQLHRNLQADTPVECATACNGADPKTITVINGFTLEDASFADIPATGFLYNAGEADSDGGNYELLGEYWLVYDCNTKTMFAKALIQPGSTIQSTADVSWVKTGNYKWADGNSATFEFITNGALENIGFLVSFAYDHETNPSCGFQVHVNNQDDQTASSGRRPEFCYEVVCQNCDSTCNDGDICTTDNTCGDGYCNFVPIGGCCEVDNDCEGASTCGSDNQCIDPPMLGCDDNSDCSGATCECVERVCVAGDACGADTCADSNECSGLTCACVEGVCVDPMDDSCQPVTDPCDGMTCDDSNACTIDTCEAGVCINTAKTCDDGYTCTVDTCDEATGFCVYTPIPDFCDDSVPCTVDACYKDFEATTFPTEEDGSGCVYIPNNLACDDNVPCTDDICDIDNGCSNPPIVDFCNDNIGCTEDSCAPENTAEANSDGCVNKRQDVFCTGVGVTDGIACTLDLCLPGPDADADSGCVFEPDDTKCDDRDECTDDFCRPSDPFSAVDGCVAEETCCPYGDYGFSYKCGTTQFICAHPESNLYNNFVASGDDGVYELEGCTVGTGKDFEVRSKGQVVASYDAVVVLDYPACVDDTFPSGVDLESGKCPNNRGLSNFAIAKCVSDPTTESDLWSCCGKTDVDGDIGDVDIATQCGSDGGPTGPGPAPSPYICEREGDATDNFIVSGCDGGLVCA